jgi:hypothetical protein
MATTVSDGRLSTFGAKRVLDGLEDRDRGGGRVGGPTLST